MLIRIRAVDRNTVCEWYEEGPDSNDLELARLVIEVHNYCVATGLKFIDFRGIPAAEAAAERKLIKLRGDMIGRPPRETVPSRFYQSLFLLSGLLFAALAVLALVWRLYR